MRTDTWILVLCLVGSSATVRAGREAASRGSDNPRDFGAAQDSSGGS